MSNQRKYLDGPPAYLDPTYLECYRAEENPAEAATLLATAIDWWLCGPLDDGDGSQESILIGTVERAARFIAAQPCTCDTGDCDLCARCLAIGCDFFEHKTDTCHWPRKCICQHWDHQHRILGDAPGCMVPECDCAGFTHAAGEAGADG